VGGALQMAKQRYYNSLAAGTFSLYDEKALSEMTLYGLPMLRVDMPVTSTVPLGGLSVASTPAEVSAQSVMATAVNLTFTYTPVAIGSGTYYSLMNDAQADLSVAGGYPIQPRTSRSVTTTNAIAHGALWVGGTFTDVPNFDPAVSVVLTDDLYLQTEPLFPLDYLYPSAPGTLNRFLTIDGQMHDRLVVAPGQFRASGSGTPTVGVERLYSSLQFEVYHAPIADTDFIAPSIWQVGATSSGSGVGFDVLVTDDSGSVARVVVLYRATTSATWSKAELTYDPATQHATGSVSGLGGVIEYFAQAVDGSGNVALALDHGNAFALATSHKIYLPLIQR
jgi:hypothetical protein